ncbi:hypothetical protein OEZ86_013302 [Tetradesmus obliquus]|nr:hypothetical protein OEZ86_013302 [Tetradesmus obliquus]
MQSICPQSLASGSAVCQKQQQQPTSLEHAQHTVEELQLMARPLKATLATLIQLNESSSDEPASPMLLCHLHHLERCHPRLWIKQQQHLPDLWCGTVPLDSGLSAAPAEAPAQMPSPWGNSSIICWQWLSKYEGAKELLSSLQQLRRDMTSDISSGEAPAPSSDDDDSNSSSAANNAAASPATDNNVLINQQQLAAFESALGLLSGQLASLVAGAAAVEDALRQAGLLPSDGSSIRAALQEATAAGQLAGWASQGLQQAQQQVAEGHQDAQDADWLVVVADEQGKQDKQ